MLSPEDLSTDPNYCRLQESVILGDDDSENCIADAKNFVQSAKYYAERGIPHRKGYLLYGPPGTGKTSFCQVSFSFSVLGLPYVLLP